MQGKYEIFDPASVTLERGIHLVEASAGTGKTYAIGMLVLRALVEQDILLENILIVTFTRGATEELRGRIRARLVEALELLIGKGQGSDPTLNQWASTVSDVKNAIQKLRVALSTIDLAAIFTIHGFCQRMLAEQAMESGQFFDAELSPDVQPFRQEVAEDFWREHVYPLPPMVCSVVTAHYSEPRDLLDSVKDLFRNPQRIEPASKGMEVSEKDLLAAYERFKKWWQKEGGEFASSLRDAVSAGSFNKPVSDGYESWLDGVEQFFSARYPILPNELNWLDAEVLVGFVNKKKYPTPEKRHEVIGDLSFPGAVLKEFTSHCTGYLLNLRLELVSRLEKDVQQRLGDRGLMGFDDLIGRLASGLKGKRGNRLQEILASRYQMALIDEFQDTDSSQWFIFQRLFSGPGHSLYLIGDPKQAIYRFRGADIHSYFSAKKSADRWLTLSRNYRSHRFLIEEINRLFGEPEKPFRMKASELEYLPVEAAIGDGDLDLVQGEESICGFVWCQLQQNQTSKTGLWSVGDCDCAFRDFVVAEIGKLLGGEDRPVLRVTRNCVTEKKKLTAGDIAILVRSRRQAQQYRHQLAAAGFPVVSSGDISVFRSDECVDLCLLLRYLVDISDTRLLKTVMTSSWFGLTGEELERLWHDERWLSEVQSRFVSYSSTWAETGCIAMMEQLLREEGVLSRLAGLPQAERRIVNIRHLLELLGEEERSGNRGPSELLGYLVHAMKEENHNQETELLLESDEDAITIVTMHGAKGLEYPVVFCPYLWYSKDWMGREKEQVLCYDGGRVLDIGSTEFEARKNIAAEEMSAEELRLAYVALTRAKTLCYVMWADITPRSSILSSFSSPLGHLLFGGQQCDFEEQQHLLQSRSLKPGISYRKVESVTENQIQMAVEGDASLFVCPKFPRDGFTTFQRTSFSGLAGLTEEEDLELLPVQGEKWIPHRGLPSGPAFGNVIHQLLEEIDFGDLAGEEPFTSHVETVCNRYGVVVDTQQLRSMLRMVVKTPLMETGAQASFCLSDLAPEQCLAEMAFCFQLHASSTDHLNALLADQPTVAPLEYRAMLGYMTGFIDLICVHDDRYYLMDYKTNHLGEYLEQYQPEQLVNAMREHNYGLQYWLYTLVLHRFLKRNVPNYSYEKCFGGVYYLFLRGMTPEIPDSGVYTDRPPFEIIEQLGEILGGGLS